MIGLGDPRGDTSLNKTEVIRVLGLNLSYLTSRIQRETPCLKKQYGEKLINKIM
jgi:hypothetical protein